MRRQKPCRHVRCDARVPAIAILAFGLVSRVLLASPPVVTSDYDQFDQRTTIRMHISDLKVEHGTPAHDLILRATHGGSERIEKIEIVTFVFVCRATEWEYLKDQKDLRLSILVGDNRIDYGLGGYDNKVERNSVSEFLAFDIPGTDFVKICEQQRCPLKLGLNRFGLEPYDIEAIRRFGVAVGLLEPAPAPPPPTELVPFEESPAGASLIDKLSALKDIAKLAQHEEIERVRSSGEYVALLKAMEDADRRRKTSSGNDRLAASKTWLESRNRMEFLEASVDAAESVVKARSDVLAAESALANAREQYSKRPSTRPATRPSR